MSEEQTTEEQLDAEQGEQDLPNMPFFLPNDEQQSVYRFILASAKRARQLQSGARPSIAVDSRKPTRIGMEEVRQGAVEVEILDEAEVNSYALMMDQPRQEAPEAAEE